MTARDELAELTLHLHMALAPKALISEARKLAIGLLAAGYRKPRTITTVEELDALPVGSVILDRDGDAWQGSSSGWTCTVRAANSTDQPSGALVNVLGPATVLHEPQP